MKFSKALFLFVGLILLIFVVPAVLFERVPPSKYGVKQNLWAGGIVKKDYDTGFHLGITGYHRWYMLDKRTHFLNFSEIDYEFDSKRNAPSLEIRTRDNNTATVDVTVTYRIIPGKAHELVENGLREVYQDRVKSTVESVLREQLAQLTSEDFYDTETRLARAKSTLPELTGKLENLYVVPTDILIRAVRFPDRYEQKLQEKQLTYQRARLYEAQEKVEKQLQVTGTLEKEIEAAEKELRGDWDKRLQTAESENRVAIATVRAEAEVYDKRTRADADAEYETLVAEGKLALDKSEALRNDLRNRALDTLGGRIFLARQAAENLNIDTVVLNSNDPAVPTIIDVGAMVELLVGDKE